MCTRSATPPSPNPRRADTADASDAATSAAAPPATPEPAPPRHRSAAVGLYMSFPFSTAPALAAVRYCGSASLTDGAASIASRSTSAPPLPPDPSPARSLKCGATSARSGRDFFARPSRLLPGEPDLSRLPAPAPAAVARAGLTPAAAAAVCAGRSAAAGRASISSGAASVPAASNSESLLASSLSLAYPRNRSICKF